MITSCAGFKVSITMKSVSVLMILGCIQQLKSEVTTPAVCTEPSCPIGCTIQTSDNGTCAVCDCNTGTEEEDVQPKTEVTPPSVCTEPSCTIGCTIQNSGNDTCSVCDCNTETEEEDLEPKISNCTKALQSDAEKVYRFFKVKYRNVTCEELFDQSETGNNSDENNAAVRCIAGTFYVTDIARYFGLKVNVTCMKFEELEDEGIINYDQSTECKLGQFFAAHASVYFNLKVSYTCDENYDAPYYDVNDGESDDSLKESNTDTENKTSNNCKLKKFVGAYKVKNLNSKDNDECEDDVEEKDDVIVPNSANQDHGKKNLTTNCKLRKFVGAYKVKNLNWGENEDCEDAEEEVDDDIEVDNDKQDSDNDKPIDEAITTIEFDDEETTHTVDENETTEVVEGTDKTKPPNAVRCKLRQFLAAHISKNFNAKSIVDCSIEDEKDDEDDDEE